MKQPFKEDVLSQYGISSHHYANPQFSNENISDVYSIPYEEVTLTIGDSDLDLETMISLRENSHAEYK